MDTRFWEHADHLVAASTVVIDRPRNHPDAIYPLDYGYLEGTVAMNGGGIYVWRGSLPEARVTGAIVAVDLSRRDAEVKLLLGCTAQEADLALDAHQSASQAALLVLRPSDLEQRFVFAQQDATARYDVEVRRLLSRPVAGIRAVTTPAEISSTFRRLLAEIEEHLHGVGVRSAGAPYARYFHYGADRVDMEAGIGVVGKVPGNSRVEPGELPGGEVATIVHIGPHDRLIEAYNALTTWIRDQGRQEAGAPWEVYVVGPESGTDPEEWKTEIFWPLG